AHLASTGYLPQTQAEVHTRVPLAVDEILPAAAGDDETAVGRQGDAVDSFRMPLEATDFADLRCRRRSRPATHLDLRFAAAGDGELARRERQAAVVLGHVDFVLAGPQPVSARLQRVLAAAGAVVNREPVLGQQHLNLLIVHLDDE